MAALQNAIPQPLVFSLDRSERARLRAHLVRTSGFWGQIFSTTLLASIGIVNGIDFARIDGWHSAFVSGAICVSGIYFVAMTLQAFGRCTVPPHLKTTLTFDPTGFSLVRNGSGLQATRIPCARVRSVRSTSETIGIYGAWRPYAIVPKVALPDDGTQLMRFFADRIVSDGLSESTSRGVTTLVNSVTPLFARG